jgi:alcohol dehydrogenase class IV
MHEIKMCPVPLIIETDGWSRVFGHCASRNLRAVFVHGAHTDASEILDRGDGYDLKISTYEAPSGEPSVAAVHDFTKFVQELHADVVVAMGGGRVMDLAKGTIAELATGRSVTDMWFDNGHVVDVKIKPTSLVCIPTTPGSGSEVSRGSMILDPIRTKKRLVAGPSMMSSLSILDGSLLCSMPFPLLRDSLFDTLCHALEVLVGKNYNPFSFALAMHSTKLLSDFDKYDCIVVKAEETLSPEQGEKLLIASALAAMGFSKGLGVAHALSHAIGGRYHDIPHAGVIRTILPHAIKRNTDDDSAATIYASAQRAMDRTAAVKGVDGFPDEVEKMFSMLDSAPSKTLTQWGVEWDSLAGIIVEAMTDHCMKTNPVILGELDLLRILVAAM